MDLRSLKKEAHNLPDIHLQVAKLQKNWLKPIRSNSNSHLPFLKDLEKEKKQQINAKLAEFKSTLEAVKLGRQITQKLQYYSRHLIDMKLDEIRGESRKSKIITNHFLNDEFLNFKKTINEIKLFEQSVTLLQQQYLEINNLLEKELSLDESVQFMDLPHKQHLASLHKNMTQHKKLIKQIGTQFITLAK